MVLTSRVKRLLGVAAVYALCGVLSAYLSGKDDFTVGKLVISPVVWFTPIPFALVSAALLPRTWRAVLTALLVCAVWIARTRSRSERPATARLLGYVSRRIRGRPWRGTCRFNRTSKAACTQEFGRSCSHRLSCRIAFGAWLARSNNGGDWILWWAFPIWQVGVGTCLYFFCTEDERARQW